MPHCDNCNAHVSRRFQTVFADDEGNLLACPSCSPNAGIAESSRDRSNSGESAR